MQDYGISFPHGLGFSSDGKYMGITHFGDIKLNSSGYISSWGKKRKEGALIFKMDSF